MTSGNGRIEQEAGPFAGSPDPLDPAQAGQPISAMTTADSAEFAKLSSELAERTADLQRITAEYANYRKRISRDAESSAVNAKAALANELLPVLDDLELAKAHGDLNGAFKSVADRLIGALERAGLVGFGAEGDAFDPAHHEAVSFGTSTEVSEPTVTSVLRRGYSFKDRSLRAAVVVVTGPDHDKPDHDKPDHVTAAPAPVEEAVDDADRAEDAQARAEQESKQDGAPDLGAPADQQ